MGTTYIQHQSMCPGDLAKLLGRHSVDLPALCADIDGTPTPVVTQVVYDLGTDPAVDDPTVVSTIHIGPDGAVIDGPLVVLDSAACCC